MPNLATAEETICQALFDALPSTPIVWPNKDWDLEVQGSHPREGDSTWGAFHILHDGSDQRSMGQDGGRVFTRTGTVQLQVFSPLGQRGLSPSSPVVMAAIAAFEGRTIGGVRFYRAGAHTVKNDQHYQVNVKADFEFDEVK